MGLPATNEDIDLIQIPGEKHGLTYNLKLWCKNCHTFQTKAFPCGREFIEHKEDELYKNSHLKLEASTYAIACIKCKCFCLSRCISLPEAT